MKSAEEVIYTRMGNPDWWCISRKRRGNHIHQDLGQMVVYMENTAKCIYTKICCIFASFFNDFLYDFSPTRLCLGVLTVRNTNR